MRRMPEARRSRATTSWDVVPRGLSTLRKASSGLAGNDGLVALLASAHHHRLADEVGRGHVSELETDLVQVRAALNDEPARFSFARDETSGDKQVGGRDSRLQASARDFHHLTSRDQRIGTHVYLTTGEGAARGVLGLTRFGFAMRQRGRLDCKSLLGGAHRRAFS